jgi:small subunit ribosomal protein S8
MTSNDPIADLLTRLRNASRARKAELLVPYSRIKADLAAILKKEGYITDFEVKSEGKPQLRIVNKFADKTPAITGLKRVSRPGLRRYVGAEEIPRARRYGYFHHFHAARRAQRTRSAPPEGRRRIARLCLVRRNASCHASATNPSRFPPR